MIGPTKGDRVLSDISRERQRQIDEEGYGAGHDDIHTAGELVMAAAYYAWNSLPRPHDRMKAAGLWPNCWSRRNVKRHSPRRALVIAGALLVAEIERLDRATGRAEEPLKHAVAQEPPPIPAERSLLLTVARLMRGQLSDHKAMSQGRMPVGDPAEDLAHLNEALAPFDGLRVEPLRGE